MKLAIIGGSGATGLVSGSNARPPDTPWGPASSAMEPLAAGNSDAVFLNRHGSSGAIAPHLINYRANLWAVREAGARAVIAVNTVGGIGDECRPGKLIVPDQLVDYTSGRPNTYCRPEERVVHTEFTEPFDPGLRAALLTAAAHAGVDVVDGATYAVTQGPRLETAAEIIRLARDGCKIVGMTAMPEAILARELDLPYAMIAGVVNRAAGQGGPGPIHWEIEQSIAVVRDSVGRVLDAFWDLAPCIDG